MRIMILLCFYSLGVLTSCSILPEQDSDLKPYIRNFGKDMEFTKKQLSKYDVKFTTLTLFFESEHYSPIGKCSPLAKTVYIDPKNWYGTYESEYRRTALVYHELAHCVCLIGHNDILLPDKCPADIMHTYLPKHYCLVRHWDMYIKNLKKNCE